MLENQKIVQHRSSAPWGAADARVVASPARLLGRPPQGGGRGGRCGRTSLRRRSLQAYTLSLEEFTSWQRAVDRSGMPGLRVTQSSSIAISTSASSATERGQPDYPSVISVYQRH
jgi:hypothetical protein